jgi:hypothetical protein
MTAVSTKFVWPRGQQLELVEIPPAPASATLAGGAGLGDSRITQVGPETAIALPLEESEALYLTFSNLKRTPEACLGFARRWGFLVADARADKWESVSVWCGAIDNMRTAIEDLAAGRVSLPPQGETVGSADIRIQPGGPNGLRLAVVPRNLISALWMQLVQAVTSGAKLLSCEMCGNWFEAGAGHRRVVARFCSTACRDRFHNIRRRDKKQSIGG